MIWQNCKRFNRYVIKFPIPYDAQSEYTREDKIYSPPEKHQKLYIFANSDSSKNIFSTFASKHFKNFYFSRNLWLLLISITLIGLMILLQIYPNILGQNLTFFAQILVAIIFIFSAIEACRKSFISIFFYIGIGILGYFLEYWHIFNIYHYLEPIFIHTIVIVGVLGILLNIKTHRR